MRRGIRQALAAALLLLCALPALGQAPEIAGIFPAGGQAGVKAEVRIDGKNLQGASLLIGGHGVRVESVKADAAGNQATVILAVAPDAALGPHELRVGTPKGVSNPTRFWVDGLPSLASIEPNDDIAHAQPLTTIPIAVNGRIATPTGRDVFGFDASAGETWVFQCRAAALRSRLDPVLELHDAGGHLLRSAQTAWERDPTLIHRFAVTGRYYITVRDTQFQGGLDCGYRLLVGPLPTITGFTPRGGRPGETVSLAVQGVNLGTTRWLTVSIPQDAGGEFWVAPSTANGVAVPIPLVVGGAAVTVADETPGDSVLPALPATVDAVFSRNPVRRYRFVAARGDNLVFELWGWRLGSRVDGALRLLDGTGKEIPAAVDDGSKEPRISYAFTTPGTYWLEARNVDEKTGPDCYYRLTVRRRAPEFRLLLDIDRLHIGAGGSTVVPVRVVAPYGHPANIALQALDLPTGVACSGGTIAPDQEVAEITLTARPDAVLGAAPIRLRGAMVVANRPVTVDVIPRDQYMPRFIDPAMFQDDSYRRPYHEWDLLPLGVIARAEPFALEASPGNLKLKVGQPVQIRVHAVRRPGANGEIKLELHGVPEHITVTAPSIPANQAAATITLTAAPDASPAERTIVVIGHMDQATQPAPALALSITR